MVYLRTDIQRDSGEEDGLMSTINTVIAKVNDIKLNDYNAEIKASWIIEIDGRIYREIHNMQGNQPPLEYPRDGDKELLVKAPYDNIYELYLFAMIDFNNREIVNYNNSVELFNTAYAEYGRFYQRELANPGRMQFDTMGFIKCNERNSVENKYADEKIKVHNNNISSHAPIREMTARIYSMCTEKIAELSDALSGKLSKSNLLEHDTDASAHSEIIRGIRNDINGHRMRFDNDEADISKNAADIAVITSATQTLGTSVSKKVDKAEEKGLSSNDYTDTDKASLARLNQHVDDKNNPHNVTKAQLGLDKVDNTPDAEKSVAYATDAGYAERAQNADSAVSADSALSDWDGNNIVDTYATKAEVSTALGDISAALDSIVELQNSYIGGTNA